MLLAVNVGNSHTVTGVFYDQALIHQWQLKSDAGKTADELAIRYHSLFQIDGIQKEDITAFAVSSVVPALESSWLLFASKYLTSCVSPPLAVSHRTDTGLSILTANPAELGADRIANAVAAWESFGAAAIVVDLGTAITFDCVSNKAEHLGGAICPGIGIALDALAERTAKLPRVELNGRPEAVIGGCTVDAIRSGVLHGSGGMIDRMAELLGKEMRERGAAGPEEKINVIATGGMAELITPYSAAVEFVDPMLTLTGLRLIHERSLREAEN
ncbi:type III pantothenate kinase [Candidatus Electronema sp. JC]|uniref:type III pantothenate kinase n=1 Tax=Candidatus Electronema sp. JC TaxID=3401570 RepID=UPI003B42B57F